MTEIPDGTTITFPTLGPLTKKGRWWHRKDGGQFGHYWITKTFTHTLRGFQ